MKKRILLVEDEERLLDIVKLNLELEGYDVSEAMDGHAALEAFHKGRFDLVLLDVMLPKMDGFAVCRAIRLENRKVPILFLTAKNSSKDRVMGLKIGGDDYLVKPFELEELLLRVQRLLERSATDTGNVGMDFYEFGPNKVDFKTYKVHDKNGREKELSRKEIMLLRLLIERRGEVVSREEMLELIWGYDVYPTTRTIDNYFLTFRKLFEKEPKEPEYFHSVRGVGYRFEG